MLLTRKATSSAAPQARLSRGVSTVRAKTMDRRTFLRRSGVGVGGAAVASQLPFSMIGQAEAKEEQASGKIEVKRSVCTHCSVGCSIDAVVQNGTWIRQEPGQVLQALRTTQTNASSAEHEQPAVALAAQHVRRLLRRRSSPPQASAEFGTTGYGVPELASSQRSETTFNPPMLQFGAMGVPADDSAVGRPVFRVRTQADGTIVAKATRGGGHDDETHRCDVVRGRDLLGRYIINPSQYLVGEFDHYDQRHLKARKHGQFYACPEGR